MTRIGFLLPCDPSKAVLKLYELHIAHCNDSVVVHFRPVVASARRKYLAWVFGIDAVIVLMLELLFRHWWAWLLFPLLIAYGTRSSYRRLHCREELRLDCEEFSVALYFDQRLRWRAACKPAFVTNVRFSGPGHRKPSYIRLELEGRCARFAEGIDYQDACTMLAALADSDLLPNPAQVHFE